MRGLKHDPELELVPVEVLQVMLLVRVHLGLGTCPQHELSHTLDLRGVRVSACYDVGGIQCSASLHKLGKLDADPRCLVDRKRILQTEIGTEMCMCLIYTYRYIYMCLWRVPTHFETSELRYTHTYIYIYGFRIVKEK